LRGATGQIGAIADESLQRPIMRTRSPVTIEATGVIVTVAALNDPLSTGFTERPK
jgi:hypothetical protein